MSRRTLRITDRRRAQAGRFLPHGETMTREQWSDAVSKAQTVLEITTDNYHHAHQEFARQARRLDDTIAAMTEAERQLEKLYERKPPVVAAAPGVSDD